jgi:hypothetical protein
MRLLEWLGQAIRDLFTVEGWKAALIVIVTVVLLLTFVAWLLGIDVAGWIQ